MRPILYTAGVFLCFMAGGYAGLALIGYVAMSCLRALFMLVGMGS